MPDMTVRDRLLAVIADLPVIDTSGQSDGFELEDDEILSLKPSAAPRPDREAFEGEGDRGEEAERGGVPLYEVAVEPTASKRRPSRKADGARSTRIGCSCGPSAQLLTSTRKTRVASSTWPTGEGAGRGWCNELGQSAGRPSASSASEPYCQAGPPDVGRSGARSSSRRDDRLSDTDWLGRKLLDPGGDDRADRRRALRRRRRPGRSSPARRSCCG